MSNKLKVGLSILLIGVVLIVDYLAFNFIVYNFTAPSNMSNLVATVTVFVLVTLNVLIILFWNDIFSKKKKS